MQEKRQLSVDFLCLKTLRDSFCAHAQHLFISNIE